MRALAGFTAILAATGLAGAAFAQAPAGPPQPTPEPVARGVWLIPGAMLPERQPDGNTVVFEGRGGLVVVDTGRHRWHRQAILDFAKGRSEPIVAIVNSHWHLDHVSGNPDLKAAYPAAKVYASNAIDGALTGFLAKSAAEARTYVDSGKAPPSTLEDIRGDIATYENGAALRPDVVVAGSGAHMLAGLRLRLNLAADAATDGDVWVYDPASRVAAVGDLVTLPAAFLDTACPKGWRAALDKVWATPFVIAVPGHGKPMTRAQFAAYRTAFGALIDCAASDRDKAACAADWTKGISPLVGGDQTELKRATGMTAYYVGDVLRAHGGKSATCASA
jgi:glyoxylase-like metal-dependent hydrolase (beta-lactamase superfamily II)